MAPQAPGWTVKGQREDWQVDPQSGQAVHGMEVAFTTQYGHHGTVFVPAGQYVPERVRQLIAEKAAAMDAVAKLSG